MNRRQRLFVNAYTRRGAETHGHGTNSAIAAGYAMKCAGKHAHRLLKNDEIRRKIAEIEENEQKNARMSLEEAIVEAKRQYSLCKEGSREKAQWFDRICNLEGLYIDKKEIKSETVSKVEIEEHKAQQIAEIARRSLKDALCHN